jgi:hypothetical protein
VLALNRRTGQAMHGVPPTSTSWRSPLRTDSPMHSPSCTVRSLLKRDDAKAADDLTITELARSADESTHMAMALTSHTGPNAALEPRPRSEATRVLQAVRLQPSARSAG